ncbi:MAG: FKBP-type peptidyl-prolyl cis-trans isomerase, partial [Patescibacteria group bacterium]
MKRTIVFVIAAVAVLYAGVWYNRRLDSNAAKNTAADQEKAAEELAQLAALIKREDIRAGNGAEAKAGDAVRVNYLGRLADGTKFDSSYDRGEPFEFTLGAGRVILGWELGIPGMKVGGKRKLTIPPELGYGEGGSLPVIPPNATLVF